MTIRAKTILITIIFLIVGVLVAGGVYHRKAIGEWFKDNFPTKQTVNELKKENEEKDKQLADKDEEISSLNSQLATMQTNLTSLNASLNETTTKLNQKESELNTVTTQRTTLLSSITEIDNKINSTTDQTEIENLQQKKTAILNQIDSLNTEISTLTQEKETLTAEINKLKSETNLYLYIDEGEREYWFNTKAGDAVTNSYFRENSDDIESMKFSSGMLTTDYLTTPCVDQTKRTLQTNIDLNSIMEFYVVKRHNLHANNATVTWIFKDSYGNVLDMSNVEDGTNLFYSNLTIEDMQLSDESTELEIYFNHCTFVVTITDETVTLIKPEEPTETTNEILNLNLNTMTAYDEVTSEDSDWASVYCYYENIRLDINELQQCNLTITLDEGNITTTPTWTPLTSHFNLADSSLSDPSNLNPMSFVIQYTIGSVEFEIIIMDGAKVDISTGELVAYDGLTIIFSQTGSYAPETLIITK